MDVHERLGLDEVAADTLIAEEHRHRYAVAARAAVGRRVLDLCCGVGYGSAALALDAVEVVAVDRDADAVAAGESEMRRIGRTNVTFAVADALDYLRAIEPGRFDLVVCFEGLEHLPQLDLIVAELARLVEAGAALIASVPNSATYEEENEFHLTDFDLERAQALAARLPGATMAFQTHAEGTLIRTGGAEDSIELRVTQRLRPDAEWANQFLLFAGVEPGALLAGGDAALHATVAPVNHRHMRRLERINHELWEANQRLERDADAGRAALEDQLARERERAARLDRELAQAVRERDEHRRAWVVVRHSRITRLAARLAGHRFDG